MYKIEKHRLNNHIAVECDVMVTQNLIYFRDYVGKYCLGHPPNNIYHSSVLLIIYRQKMAV